MHGIKRGKFVCFTGIDGSGKTTLAKSIVYEMQKKKWIANTFMADTNRFF